MKIQEAIDHGVLLRVTVEPDNRRGVAELVIVPGGVVYADLGWHLEGTHPFHFLGGQRTEDPPWRFILPPAVLEVLEPDDPAAFRILEWRRFRETPDGKPFGRDRFLQALRGGGFIA